MGEDKITGTEANLPPDAPQPLLERLSRYRVRISVFIIVALVLKDLLLKTRPNGYLPETPLGIAGLVLVLAGVLLRSWSAGIIHKSHVLATNGPYALARHPLYLGSFFLALGFFLIIGRWGNLIFIVLAAGLLYVPLIRKEEKSLMKLFGEDWVKYTRHTGSVCPKTYTALSRVFAPWSPAQWVKNREYRCAAASIAALVLLSVWRVLVE